MTGDWKTGPLPEVEGLYWCAGEDQGGYPCISAFRRTCRHATPFDPAHPMREIPLVWGYQRVDPGIGYGVSEWEKGDLPRRTVGWQRIERPPHPYQDRLATTATTHRLECGLCGADWLDVPADEVEAARKAQTECLGCHKPMAPETWTVYPLVSTTTATVRQVCSNSLPADECCGEPDHCEPWDERGDR